MKSAGLRYRDEWLPNFYPARRIRPDALLRISRVGTTQILSEAEDRQINEVFMDEALFRRLERTGHIVTHENAHGVLHDLARWHERTYSGPTLHIAVLTKRCNLNCTYCHMNPEAIGSDPETFDMTPETAEEVIRFALSTPAPSLNFEFQGGEPFLNFPCMVHFVEAAESQALAIGKQVEFSVVSNLMLVKDEHMEFCRQHKINVSYTLNGPESVHDRFRISRSGAGSFRVVLNRLRALQAKYGDILSTSPLCVVGSDNAQDLIPTIEFFHEQGFKGVAILKLKALGNSAKNELAFDIGGFLRHYVAALDHIYEKNRRLNADYSERTLRVLLAKTLSPTDIGFVDWRNPNGDFSGAITYDYDGEILNSDEARSLRHEFGLGNVRDRRYDEMVRDRKTFRTMNLSLRDRDETCRECAFNPYCGLLPVLDFARTGDATPRPHESEECLQTIAVLDWLFSKLLDDPIPLFRMLPGMDEILVRMADGLGRESDGRAA